jgi:hypothetical protein
MINMEYVNKQGSYTKAKVMEQKQNKTTPLAT